MHDPGSCARGRPNDAQSARCQDERNPPHHRARRRWAPSVRDPGFYACGKPNYARSARRGGTARRHGPRPRTEMPVVNDVWAGAHSSPGKPQVAVRTETPVVNESLIGRILVRGIVHRSRFGTRGRRPPRPPANLATSEHRTCAVRGTRHVEIAHEWRFGTRGRCPLRPPAHSTPRACRECAARGFPRGSRPQMAFRNAGTVARCNHQRTWPRASIGRTRFGVFRAEESGLRTVDAPQGEPPQDRAVPHGRTPQRARSLDGSRPAPAGASDSRMASGARIAHGRQGHDRIRTRYA